MPLEATPIESVKIPEPLPTVENMAAARALATPLPGPAALAFQPGMIEVAGHNVRKVVAYDYVFWHFTDCPVLQQILELAKPEDQRENVISNDQQEYELAWQFVNPASRLKDVMAKGREAVAKVAFDEVGGQWNANELRLVLLAIFEQIKRSAETGNRWAGEAKEKGEITFFRESPPPA